MQLTQRSDHVATGALVIAVGDPSLLKVVKCEAQDFLDHAFHKRAVVTTNTLMLQVDRQ